MVERQGVPSIDSLKQISNLFGVSIDELIADSDIENKKMLDEAQSRKFYWWAIACLAVTTVSAIVFYFTELPYLNVLSILGMVGYIVLGVLSKPKYKRMAQRRMIVVPFIISRLVIAIIIIVVIVSAFFRA